MFGIFQVIGMSLLFLMGSWDFTLKSAKSPNPGEGRGLDVVFNYVASGSSKCGYVNPNKNSRPWILLKIPDG